MIRRTVYMMGVILSIIHSEALYAQEPATMQPFAPTSDTTTSSINESTIYTRGVPAAPPDRVDRFVQGINFDLDVSQAESSTSLSIGGGSVENFGNNTETLRQRSKSWLLSATVPFGGSDDATNTSLDALADGFKLEGAISFFNWSSAATTLNDPNGPMKEAVAKCKRIEADQTICERGPSAAFIRRYLGEVEANRLLFQPMTRIGINASIGFDKFSYINSDIEQLHSNKTQLSVGAFLNFYPSDALSSLTGKLEYQNAFKASPETTVCRSIVKNATEDCEYGSDAHPINIERLNTSLEYRRLFPLNNSGSDVGLASRGTLDAVSGDWEVDISAYFVSATSKNILPGLKIVYNSDSETTFSIFLRSAFTLN